MLVLSRKTGQKLIIANDIEVTILETKGDSVKLGINAPKSISVYREEIYEEIKKANKQATQASQATDLDSALNLAHNFVVNPGKPNLGATGREAAPSGAEE